MAISILLKYQSVYIWALNGSKRVGTYLRIPIAEIACSDSALKNLHKYFAKNSKKF